MPAADRRAPPRVTLVGGKGGVGKTTVAAALALMSSRRGQRTLLVSTDPAHSTADLLGVEAGSRPVPVDLNWSLLEIDAEQVARAHVERIAEEAEDVVPRDVMPAVRRHLRAAVASPGTHESALLDRLSDVLLASVADHAWDRVVVDTAPTGHTLRLLALPDLLTGWVDGLLSRRGAFLHADALARGLGGDVEQRPDPVAERLRTRRDQLAATRELLTHDAVVHLVLVPERLAVLETLRARETLDEAGLRLGHLVVNRVFPAGDDPFLLTRARGQEASLRRLAEELPGVQRAELPHLAQEPGPEDLPLLADLLAAAGVH